MQWTIMKRLPNLALQSWKHLAEKQNIVEIDNCISRLRLILKDSAKVNEKALKATGSLGLIRINEENVQVVYGAKVEKAAAELKRAVEKSRGQCGRKARRL